MFLKISQISQENSLFGVSFRLATLLKKDFTPPPPPKKKKKRKKQREQQQEENINIGTLVFKATT